MTGMNHQQCVGGDDLDVSLGHWRKGLGTGVKLSTQFLVRGASACFS